jgi:hypothetical protein
MRGVIEFVLGNFTLTFFVLGLIASAIALWHARQPRSDGRDRRSAVLVFPAVLDRDSRISTISSSTCSSGDGRAFIGWADSPFQLEVGFASLGLPLSACWLSKAASTCGSRPSLGPACFLWGAAAVHVYQMITAHNFAPGNAGVIFYSDILVPSSGFLFLWLQRRLAARQAGRPLLTEKAGSAHCI